MQNRMDRLETSGVELGRQTHVLPVRIGTSLPVGRAIPLDFFPVLREDSLSLNVNWSLQMSPTFEMLVNPPRIKLEAWFVSKLAEPRFSGSSNVLLRSYFGQPETDSEDAPVIDYFETKVMGEVSSNAIARYLGLHYDEEKEINTTPWEVYNLIYNFKAENRSHSIEKRDLDDTSLAPAFWVDDGPFSRVVPRVDTGLIAGEIPLTVVEGRMPVTGLGKVNGEFGYDAQAVKEAGGVDRTYESYAPFDNGNVNNRFVVEEDPDNPGFPGIAAVLQEQGIKASLAGIQQGGKIARFARERLKREGWSDEKTEFYIDAMLQGFSIPEGELLKPMLLNTQLTEVAQVLDTAKDGASLGMKYTLGMAKGTFSFRLPGSAHGGTVMIIAEVLPQQLYEDMADPLLHATSPDDLPNRLVDELRVEPYAPIKNRMVSVYHSEPDKQFGFDAVNGQWGRHPVRFGGELHRTAGGTFGASARLAIYPTEYVDPKLTEDFYLSEQIGNDPFMEPDSDPIKLGMRGNCVVNGLTLIGYAAESDENYDKVAEVAPSITQGGSV